MKTYLFAIAICLFAVSMNAQKLELEWNGSKEDLIQLIEGGKVRFSIEGHSAGVPDRITFKIKTEPADTLTNVMTLVEEGYLRLEKDPIHPKDAVTKAYLMNFGISLVGIQGMLDAGYCPLELVSAGIVKDSLYGKNYQGGLIFYLDDQDTIPGIKGLVAAPMDQDFEGDFERPWGCEGTDLPIPNNQIMTGPGSDIGEGFYNTIGIDTSGCALPGDGAVVCATLSLNGFNDWFLPSWGELRLMFEHLTVVPDDFDFGTDIGNNFENDIYMTSTEGGDLVEMGLVSYAPNSYQLLLKSTTTRFRAARSF